MAVETACTAPPLDSGRARAKLARVAHAVVAAMSDASRAWLDDETPSHTTSTVHPSPISTAGRVLVLGPLPSRGPTGSAARDLSGGAGASRARRGSRRARRAPLRACTRDRSRRRSGRRGGERGAGSRGPPARGGGRRRRPRSRRARRASPPPPASVRSGAARRRGDRPPRGRRPSASAPTRASLAPRRRPRRAPARGRRARRRPRASSPPR